MKTLVRSCDIQAILEDQKPHMNHLEMKPDPKAILSNNWKQRSRFLRW